MEQFLVLVLVFFVSISSCTLINFGEVNDNNHNSDSSVSVAIGPLSSNVLKNLPVGCSSKYLIEQRFDIPELVGFDSHEPEFDYILSLFPLAQNPYHVFLGLLEDVLNEKKPYNVLYPPLIAYLARTFKSLTAEQQNIHLKSWNNSFELFLADNYSKKGEYKSAFETVINNPRDVMEWYFSNSNNIKIYEMFKENPAYAAVLTAAFDNASVSDGFITGISQRICWILNCILFDAPESFYIKLLNDKPDLLRRLLMYRNILPNQITIADKPRIHDQFNKLISKFINENERNFYYLLVDILFGTGQNFDSSINYDRYQIKSIFLTSIVGQNKSIFHQIYRTHKETILASLDSYFSFPLLDKVMFLFEVFNLGDEDIIVKNIYNFALITRFYVIKNIKIIDDKMVFDIVAPETLLEFGLPQNFTFTFDLIENNFDLLTKNLWKNLNIIDEETFYSFLCDYGNLPISNRNIETSVEVIKFILKSLILMEKVKEIGIKLSFLLFPCSLIDFLDSIESTEGLNQIFDLTGFQNKLISFLRDKKQLKKFEEIFGLNVVEIFLNEDNGLMQESDYFRWRVVLDYLISGDQRQRISEIRSPIIIKMLRFEFHDDMLELLGNEE